MAFSSEVYVLGDKVSRITVSNYNVDGKLMTGCDQIIDDMRRMYQPSDTFDILSSRFRNRVMGKYSVVQREVNEHIMNSAVIAIHQETRAKIDAIRLSNGALERVAAELQTHICIVTTIRRLLAYLQSLLSLFGDAEMRSCLSGVFQLASNAAEHVIKFAHESWGIIRDWVGQIIEKVVIRINNFARPYGSLCPILFVMCRRSVYLLRFVIDLMDRRKTYPAYEMPETHMQSGERVTVERQPYESNKAPLVTQMGPAYMREQTVIVSDMGANAECYALNTRLTDIVSNPTEVSLANMREMAEIVLEEHGWENTVEPMDFRNGSSKKKHRRSKKKHRRKARAPQA